MAPLRATAQAAVALAVLLFAVGGTCLCTCTGTRESAWPQGERMHALRVDEMRGGCGKHAAYRAECRTAFPGY